MGWIRRTWSRLGRGQRIAVLVGVGLVAAGAVTVEMVLLAGQPAARHAAAPKSSPSRAAPALVSPFTGEPVTRLRPVLVVKIGNTVPERPATGLNEADLVYMIPVEGGLSRIMAVFSSHLPPVIGPVRSARQDDIKLLHEFGRPAFAYSGAQPGLLPVVEHTNIVDLYAGIVGGYFRSASRPEPYNLYAATRKLLAEAPGASLAHSIGFRFGAPPAGGRPVRSESVSYPAASFGFAWSARRGCWRVSMDGAPATSTGAGQLCPPTVVIQRTLVKTSPFIEQGRVRPPYAVTIGSGSALVLRDGQEFRARWSRPLSYGGTTFTTRTGQPMTFARGQVWIVLTDDTSWSSAYP